MDIHEYKKRLLDGFAFYPKLRDHPLKTGAQWIRGKKLDDECGDLWRVHDKLYDLTHFIDSHPGGKMWLETTRGTDITEAFESSHLDEQKVEAILAKFYRKEARNKRQSPFTFEPDGFYRTLKRRAHYHLKHNVTEEERKSGRQMVRTIQNSILLLFLFLFVSSVRLVSFPIAIVAGVVLTLNMNLAHNFFHQKDSWRMYVWDLGLLSSYEWRITHAISHHGYANSILDFEISMVEPMIDYRVYATKSFWHRSHLSLLCSLIMLPLILFIELIKRIMSISIGHQKLRLENLLPLFQLIAMRLLITPPSGGDGWMTALLLWFTMHASCSLSLVLGDGLISAHHHQNMFHPGDGEFSYGLDWGLAQLDATGDNKLVTGPSFFIEVVLFGNHVLHHMFPTLDHGLLEILRPVLWKTCRDFNLPEHLIQSFNSLSQWDLIVGTFKQMARTRVRYTAKKYSNNQWG